MSLTDRDKRKRSQAVIMRAVTAELRKKVKGLQIFGQDLSLRGFSANARISR